MPLSTGLLRIQLSASDLALLDERAEGWVTGLSMQGRKDSSAVIASLSGNHHHILSYLTEEVLKQQSPSVQKFLLQTSILARFDADLCNAVTQCSDAAAMLEQLLASNLFLVPLDDEGRWYRYHHLFAMQSQGRIPEAIESAQVALTIVPPVNVRVLGLAYLGLGGAYRQAVQFDLAIDALQQAICFSYCYHGP